MGIAAARLSQLIGDLYAAALDPSDRRVIAPLFASAFDAASCLILTCNLRSGDSAVVSCSDNFTPRLLADYAAYYHSQDIWAQGGFRLGAKRGFLGDEIIQERDLVRTEIYQDAMRRYGVHHAVGGTFEAGHGRVGLVGVHRAPGAQGFDSESQATMDLMLPHLRQAIQFAARLADNQCGQRVGMAALSALAVGAIVVGQDGRVRLINAAAERVARAGQGLAIRQGRLTLTDPALDARLRSAIHSASLAPLGRLGRPGAGIVVPTSEGQSLSLVVTPLHPDAATIGPLEPLTVVFVGERGSQPAPLPELLRAMYGLTPAETRVLMAVTAGTRIADYAVSAGVSINTANAQLKLVFAKTGCRRQAELVRLVLSDPVLRLANIDLLAPTT